MTKLSDPIHFSNLKRMAQSPAHYRASVEHPKDKAVYARGRLVHTLVLGGPKFVVWEKRRAGKEWDSFELEHAGTEIFTRAEVDRAEQIAEAVLADPVAAPYLVGDKEVALEWGMLGRKCATRGIDVLGQYFLADLKVARSSEPGSFSRDAVRYGYHAQLGFYVDACKQHYPLREIKMGVLIAVEPEEPFAVTTVRVGLAALDKGRAWNHLQLERILACEAAGEWPGYVQSVVDLQVGDDFGLVYDDEEVAA